MIHRVVLGSLERFIGVLIEHTRGALPVWLSPIQVKILTITSRCLEYAANVESKLKTEGIRVEVDGAPEKIGMKIRRAQIQKVPYMLIVGDKEIQNETLSVRKREEGDVGSFKIKEFIESIKNEIASKS
jgi:threonyl-tRNA synthetase